VKNNLHLIGGAVHHFLQRSFRVDFGCVAFDALIVAPCVLRTVCWKPDRFQPIYRLQSFKKYIVPYVSQLIIKKYNFPLNQNLICANHGFNTATFVICHEQCVGQTNNTFSKR